MRALEFDNMGAKIDGRQLQHFRFADDIVLITPNINQAERMIANFDKVCGKIGLRLNLKKTIRNVDVLVTYGSSFPFLNRRSFTLRLSSYVYPLEDVVYLWANSPPLVNPVEVEYFVVICCGIRRSIRYTANGHPDEHPMGTTKEMHFPRLRSIEKHELHIGLMFTLIKFILVYLGNGYYY
uniref:Reverse transcriptase domain-containing protein n=1 Tax=Angiostrongylus cantonensis TaxID=6313 RepID=A0A0K0CTW5_ANGCA